MNLTIIIAFGLLGLGLGLGIAAIRSSYRFSKTRLGQMTALLKQWVPAYRLEPLAKDGAVELVDLHFCELRPICVFRQPWQNPGFPVGTASYTLFDAQVIDVAKNGTVTDGRRWFLRSRYGWQLFSDKNGAVTLYCGNFGGSMTIALQHHLPGVGEDAVAFVEECFDAVHYQDYECWEASQLEAARDAVNDQAAGKERRRLLELEHAYQASLVDPSADYVISYAAFRDGEQRREVEFAETPVVSEEADRS